MMRPALRLPLRETLYVCSNCRAEVTPRGAFPLARPIRRYASSDSPSFLERARRSLWKGDQPPGPDDPYSGQSQMLREMKGNRDAKENEDEVDHTADEHETEADEKSIYMPAETWDGLRGIGYTKEQEWKVLGSAEKPDRYRRYGAQVTTKPIPIAAHQAAVEIALLRLLKKGLKNSYEIHRHPTIIQKMILQCRFDGSQQNWDAALRFPDQQTFDALTFVFNQLGKSQTMEIESSESLIAKEGTLDLQSYRTLSLADFHVKFAFYKRFSQLIGDRVPDQVITSSTTIGDLEVALSTNKKEEEKNKVHNDLMRRHKAGDLPSNVHFSDKRLKPGDRDEDLGRKKAIHAELFNRGLVSQKREKTKGVNNRWRTYLDGESATP